VEGGGIGDACQVAVGLLCVEWFARFVMFGCLDNVYSLNLFGYPD
jgi:hypothetical protein